MLKIICGIIVCSILCVSSTGFAQSSYASSGLSNLKETETQALSLGIEMILLYKLLGQPTMVSTDGGVVVLFGNKISRYDKDLNLVKSVTLDLDIASMQQLISKVAKGYSEDLVKTMGSIAPSAAAYGASSLGGTKNSANAALAKATLRSISTAAESYATANNGKYPSTIFDLTHASPPFLNTNYCDQKLSGYTYKCEFNSTSYKISANPDDSTTTAYSITTGGVLTP